MLFISNEIALLLVMLISQISCDKLPDYIKTCSNYKDEACLVQKANEVITKFAQGDSYLGTAKMDPFPVGDIVVSASTGFNMVFKDTLFHGLSSLILDSFKIDPEKGIIIVTGLIPKLDIKSKYTINGRLLIIPLQGNGDATINIKKVKVTLTFWFDTVKGEDGKNHWDIKKEKLIPVMEKAQMQLDNLFNGDKLLGDSTNQVINQMWKEVMAELSPPIVKTLSHHISEQLNVLFKKVSFEEMFPKE